MVLGDLGRFLRGILDGVRLGCESEEPAKEKVGLKPAYVQPSPTLFVLIQTG